MKFSIQNEFFTTLETEIKNNKISHSYLIETNGYSKIDEFINIMVKLLLCSNKNLEENCNKCNICKLIDSNSYPDLKIIDSINSDWIKKEQLASIKDTFSSKSIYDNKQIYVIKDASKLNAASGNTILKFLEEPAPNVIAILLTNNRYKVLETILSRCQIFSLQNNEIIDFDDKTYELIKTLFKKNKAFLHYNNLITLIPDRQEAKKYFSVIENYLFMVVNKKVTLIDELEDLSNEIIFKLILILEKYINNMEYNLNYKLTLDNLIIEINGVI